MLTLLRISSLMVLIFNSGLSLANSRDQPEFFGRSLAEALTPRAVSKVLDEACGALHYKFEATWLEKNKEVFDKAHWILTDGLSELAKEYKAEEDVARLRKLIEGELVQGQKKFLSTLNDLEPDVKTVVCKKFASQFANGEWDVPSVSPEAYSFLQKPWKEIRPYF